MPIRLAEMTKDFEGPVEAINQHKAADPDRFKTMEDEGWDE